MSAFKQKHKDSLLSYIKLGDAMKVFSLKNNRYNNSNFIAKVYHDPKVEGLVLDVIMTRDNRIIVFPEATTTTVGLESVQKKTLKEIKDSEIELLETYLKELIDFKKRIILNIIPMEQPILTDYTAETIYKQNEFYINQILEIVTRYKECVVSMISISPALLTILKSKKLDYNLGWVILSENTNYIDLGMYIFISSMLDATVLMQQLDNKKEIFVYAVDAYSIDNVLNFFKGREKNPIKQKIFDEISIITYYPDIFNNAYSK